LKVLGRGESSGAKWAKNDAGNRFMKGNPNIDNNEKIDTANGVIVNGVGAKRWEKIEKAREKLDRNIKKAEREIVGPRSNNRPLNEYDAKKAEREKAELENRILNAGPIEAEPRQADKQKKRARDVRREPLQQEWQRKQMAAALPADNRLKETEAAIKEGDSEAVREAKAAGGDYTDKAINDLSRGIKADVQDGVPILQKEPDRAQQEN
jgi:hypothetical protein